MRYQDDDSFLDLESSKSGSKPRSGRRGLGGGRGWKGSVSQRVRAARGLPPAMLKISSYSHNSGAVWDRVNYVARDGELEVEAPDGEKLDQVALEQMVADWSDEEMQGNRRVIAMSAMVSFSAGVDKEKATETARQFFGEAFGKNHDYVFAAHEDTKNFHVHVVVRAAGENGQQLRITKADIQELRELLAEKAHEQGIELDASPRWARGLEVEERLSRGAEARILRSVEKAPHLEKNRFTKEEQDIEQSEPGSIGGPAARKALAEERARRRRPPEAGEYQALEYGRAAAALAAQIPQLEKTTDKIAAVKGAVQLASFGLQLTNHAVDKPQDIAETRAVMVRVDKAINSQIRGLEEGPAQKEAIAGRRGLAQQLSEYRKAEEEQEAQRIAAAVEGAKRQTERGRSREEPGLETPEAAALVEERRRVRDPNAAARPALEYAQASGQLAAQIGKLESDEQKVAAIKGAVELGGKAWELAERGQAGRVEAEQTREIVNQVERVIHDEIRAITGGPNKRAAIQADRQLVGRLGEYRAEQREQAAKARAAEQKKGEGLEL